MRWKALSESVVAYTDDEPVDEILSTADFSSWPKDALESRAAAGLPTRCSTIRCRLTERCRVCGARP